MIKITTPQIGELEQTADSSDFRDVDGVKVPFKRPPHQCHAGHHDDLYEGREQRRDRRQDVREAVILQAPRKGRLHSLFQSVSILHVANGHGTTGLIERSGVPGRTEIWADPLNEGPVPGNVSDDELLMIRARFLASQYDAADVAADLRRWREAVDHDNGYDELVLWFEHDLFDQLNLDPAADAPRRSAAIETGHVGLHRSVSRPPGFQGARRARRLRDLAALFTTSAAGHGGAARAGHSGRGRRIDRRIRARSRSC